ncbi:hypothetical protein EVAR_66594_1 [Eumeta japonica]|uniref:Uncharacterized protein n=1 Tax=Eumeta variegata TaxID=151549 RepID=A0A4C1ZTX5_EUMVA|nr:hypothetical protein EVAR_66594_1 [Eumeta japonica]
MLILSDSGVGLHSALSPLITRSADTIAAFRRQALVHFIGNMKRILDSIAMNKGVVSPGPKTIEERYQGLDNRYVDVDSVKIFVVSTSGAHVTVRRLHYDIGPLSECVSAVDASFVPASASVTAVVCRCVVATSEYLF